MVEELQQAIMVSFQPGAQILSGDGMGEYNNQNTNSNSIQQQSVEFLKQRKQQKDIWALIPQLFEATQIVEVKFWCLQTLFELINSRLEEVQNDTKEQLKNVSVKWLIECQQNSPIFIKNKAAQVVGALIKLEYPPGRWPNIFSELVNNSGDKLEWAEGLCRVMNAMDEDVISLEIPRTKEGGAISMQLKDTLRDTCIKQLINALLQISSGIFGLDLAELALGVLKKYIHWVDIDLVANESFLSLFFKLLNSKQENLVKAAADCLYEMVGKKMENQYKIQLISEMKIVEVCSQWVHGFPIDSEPGSEVQLSLAKLVSQLAAELMEIIRYFENVTTSFQSVNMSDQIDINSIQVCTQQTEQYLNQIFPVILMVLRSSSDDVANAMIQFLSVYVSRIRSNLKKGGGQVSIGADTVSKISQILEALAVASLYPQDSCMYELEPHTQAEAQAAEEEVEDVEKKRHDLFIVFKNIAQLVPEQTAAFVEWVFKQTVTNSNNSGSSRFQDVELAISLLYELGEGANNEFSKPDCGVLGPLAYMFYSLENIPCGKHRSVALPVLECYVRYVRVLHQVPNFDALIMKILQPFLDERGIGHPSEDVSTRACYLLQRMIKQLRDRLVGQAGEIIMALRPYLSHIATTQVSESVKQAMEKTSGVLDDRLYVFEAVSYLLGLEAIPQEQQQSLLIELLNPLIIQVKENIDCNLKGMLSGPNSLPPSFLVHQALEATSRLSKGFSVGVLNRRAQLKEVFKQCIVVSLQVPHGFPGNRLLRSRVISFLHRMVDCLQSDVFPLLPRAIEALRMESGGDVEGALLLQQLVVKFKQDLRPLVEQLLPDLLTSLLGCLPQDWDWSCQGVVIGGSPRGSSPRRGILSADEELREKADVQKMIYSLLQTLISHDMLTVLLHNQKQHIILDKCLTGLVAGGAWHSEAVTRRTCTSTLLSLVKRLAGDDQAPAFWPTFATQKIGCEVCLKGVLTSSNILDVRDPAQLNIVSDAVQIIKILVQQYGNNYTQLAQQCLHACGVNQDLIQNIIQQIQFQDASVLKDTFKRLLLHKLGVMLGSQRLCQMAERPSNNLQQQQQQQQHNLNAASHPAVNLYQNGVKS